MTTPVQVQFIAEVPGINPLEAVLYFDTLDEANKAVEKIGRQIDGASKGAADATVVLETARGKVVLRVAKILFAHVAQEITYSMQFGELDS